MKENIHIRRAAVGDSIAIQKLLQQLGYAMTPKQVSEKIGIFAWKAGHHAFVAEIDDRIVGFMSLHVMEWFHRPDCIGRLSYCDR